MLQIQIQKIINLKVRSMYYIALARERYYLYKSNDYLNENEDENEN